MSERWGQPDRVWSEDDDYLQACGDHTTTVAQARRSRMTFSAEFYADVENTLQKYGLSLKDTI